MKVKEFLLFALLFSMTHFSFGQLVINELMASNSNSVPDNTGKFSDWIEIYNTSANGIDLNDYYLSDTKEHLTKFRLSAINNNLTIPPKGFLVIWCSGDTQNGNLHTSFALSAESESILLTKPDGKTVIDELSFQNQRENISYGRQPDASTTFKYFVDSSPKKTNNSIIAYIDFVKNPIFSTIGGFFKEGFDLSISHLDPSVKIYYTTDGSIPSPKNIIAKTYSYKNIYAEKNGDQEGKLQTRSYISFEYSNKIPVIRKINNKNGISSISSTWHNSPYYIPNTETNKAFIVRAVALKPGYLPSEVITNTYFIGIQGASSMNLPVISMTMQEKDLFDYTSGIYTAGLRFDTFRKDNPNKEIDLCSPGNFSNEGELWEKPGNFEFFKNNTQIISKNLDLRIHGACSRSFPYKTLRIYGKKVINSVSIFEKYPEIKQQNFILRNAGNDYNGTLFRDELAQSMVSHFDFASQKSQPSVMYLNGEYWGIHTIRQRLDKYFLKEEFGVNSENVDVRKITWKGSDEIEYGDGVHYEQMVEFLNNNDLSNDNNYNKAISFIDPESIIDFQIAEIFIGNIDWPQNNVRLWRNRTPNYAPSAPFGHDGRWRYLFYDADKSLGMVVNEDFDNLKRALEQTENNIFHIFIQNEKFKERFIVRFLDHINSSFSPKISSALLNEFKNLFKTEIPAHIARWKTIPSVQEWENNIATVERYLNGRPEKMIEFLKSNFNQGQEYSISLNTNNSNLGFIKVNSLTLEDSYPGIKLGQNGKWTGKYFSNLPTKIVAISKPGSKFLYWKNLGQTIEDSTIIINLEEDLSYIAYFEKTNLITSQNIPAASLADCGYFLKEWSAFSAKGSTPPNTKFIFLNQKDPKISSQIAGFTTGEYNLESKSRINGLEENGISFINTSGPSDNEGYPFNQLGGIILALNTVGIDSARVSWTNRTIKPGDRKYAIRLQYRMNDTDEFEDFDFNTEYIGGKTAGHEKQFKDLLLPKKILNQPYIQLFWKYYFTGSSNTGFRDEISIDNINFRVNQDLIKKTEPGVAIAENKGSLFYSINFEPLSSFSVKDTVFSITSTNYQNIIPKSPVITSIKTEICGTELLTLKAFGCVNGKILWSNGDSGRETQVLEGTYDAYCQSTCGISESSNSIKIVRVAKAKAPEINIDKNIVCEGEAVSLKIYDCGGKVFWSNGLTGNQILVKPKQDSQYSANCYANQCYSEQSAPVQIKIGKPAIPLITSITKKICLGETAYLNAQNCNGLVEWSNKIKSEVLKFTAEKSGVYSFKSRCVSKDGSCFSDWSSNFEITVSEIPKVPKTLIEIANVCPNETVNLFDAILDLDIKDKNSYSFYSVEDPAAAKLSQLATVGRGFYYLYRQNIAGCFSAPSKITVKINNCQGSTLGTPKAPSSALKVTIKSNKKEAKVGEEVQITSTAKNLSKTKVSGVILNTDITNRLTEISRNYLNENNGSMEGSTPYELNPGDSITLNITAKSLSNSKIEISSVLSVSNHSDLNMANNKAKIILNENNYKELLGLNLFSDKPKKITNTIYEGVLNLWISNLSILDVNPVQVNLDLDKTFGNGAKLIPESVKISLLENVKIDPSFNGTFNNTSLLIDSLSTFKSKTIQKAQITYKVDLEKAEKSVFYANAYLFSNNNLLDVSTEGVLADPDLDGDFNNNSQATAIVFERNTQSTSIAASQVIVDSTILNKDTQVFTFLIQVKNTGNAVLHKIKVYNNLKGTFGKDTKFLSVGSPTTSKRSKLQANENFDGNYATQMLVEKEFDSLLPNQTDSIYYSLKIENNYNFRPYFNKIIASGISANGKMVSDTSNNGYYINPSLSDPTVIKLAMDYKDLVVIRDGFSPNGDNANDQLEIFIPNGIELDYLAIFDKWGHKVKNFTMKDVQNNRILWNGETVSWFKNYEVNSGTYYYAFKTKNDTRVYVNFITVVK